MTVSIVAAVSENGVIGRDGAIPWRMQDDTDRFLRMVRGHHVIMGRRTYESHTLKHSKAIVVSGTMRPVDGVIVVPTVEDALAAAKGDPFVLGGTRVFADALPYTAWVHLTIVHARVVGDAFFPPFVRGDWTIMGHHTHAADDRNEYGYTYMEFVRRTSGRCADEDGAGIAAYQGDPERPATGPPRSSRETVT